MSPARREAVALTVAVLVYSNGLAVRAMRRGSVADQAYSRTNPLFLLTVLCVLARMRRVPVVAVLRQAGLQREGLAAAFLGGTLTGLVLALPPLLFFLRPVVLNAPLEYAPIAHLTPAALRRRVWIELPLAVALFEELVFRGLLFESWRRAAGSRAGHVATALAFAGWHGMVGVDTMRRTNLGEAADPRLPAMVRRHANLLGVLGGVAATGAAGAIFGGLRDRCRGNLLGPVLAHWITDAVMVLVLHRRGRK
ncbi:MAG TPA: CPBP family intramembrane glutamic endopeptidase [Chloroflexia bacterium]|nr:CPBP family intramembrane glutamic endopeptidase [Chloroflexia bacterium]